MRGFSLCSLCYLVSSKNYENWHFDTNFVKYSSLPLRTKCQIYPLKQMCKYTPWHKLLCVVQICMHFIVYTYLTVCIFFKKKVTLLYVGFEAHRKIKSGQVQDTLGSFFFFYWQEHLAANILSLRNLTENGWKQNTQINSILLICPKVRNNLIYPFLESIRKLLPTFKMEIYVQMIPYFPS